MKYVHHDCLLQWIQQSKNKQCSHCHYEYTLEEQYDSSLQECLDCQYIPYIIAGIIIACLFFVFHKVFRWIIHKIQNSSSSQSSSASFPPNVMNILQSTLPVVHPTFTLMINGINHARQIPFTKMNFTLLLAEIELFSFLLAGVYYISKFVYNHYYKPSQDNETVENDEQLDIEENREDVHEGLSMPVNLNSHDENDDDNEDTNSEHSFVNESSPEEHITLFDVVDSYWNETMTGSSSNFSEESIYLFPLDVLQTTFHSMHFFIKQKQEEFINKKMVIVEPT